MGERVRKLRGKRSAQWLADRCAELGKPISRSAIAKLENGRREDVALSELLIIAAALDAPPALLVFPVGTDEDVQWLPGRQADPWTAYRWFVGDLSLTPDSRDARMMNLLGGADVLDAYRRHTESLARYVSYKEHRPDEAQAYLRSVVHAREDMRRQGWRLPFIPSDVVAEVAAEESALGRQFEVWDEQLAEQEKP